jgi:hypothetical protein
LLLTIFPIEFNTVLPGGIRLMSASFHEAEG